MLLTRRTRSLKNKKNYTLHTLPAAKYFVNDDILDVNKYPKAVPYCGDPIKDPRYTITDPEERKKFWKEFVKQAIATESSFYLNNNTYCGYQPSDKEYYK